MEQAREVYTEVAEVMELLEFMESSTRGVCRSAGAEHSQE